MPVITFWSNNEKAIGQSVAASVTAAVMAIERNYKVLLISADYNNATIENCFGEQETNKEIVKSLIKKPQMNLASGVDGLLKLADSNRVTPEVIHDYTKIIFKNRLEVLYSPMGLEEEKDKARFMAEIKNIILNASRYYDYVFVDLKKGFEYSEQLEVLKSSDVIVANLDQKIKSIETFFAIEEIDVIQRKLILNICKHDKNSKYNFKNLSRTILKKQTISKIDYNTLLYDATQEGNLAELLLRFRTLKEDDENSEILSSIRKLIEAILLKYQETRLRM